ncbi:serine/threonine-protein kinase [Solirubrobacter soli]|uniref:serine/threonine-protein kinase n=1 Tax=Solirubrobacter soli TaxID=363832 RepID=UPI0003FDFD84|nr:serine/threonine-protein kinase [Solirubrobacter soli]
MSGEIAIGSMLGGYRIDSLLGNGGMGVVYRATDVARARTVALKVVDPQHADDERYRRRFRQEASTIARLAHSNIIRIWDTGEDGGVLYLSMELIDGPDLGMLLREGALPAPLAVELVSDVAQALDLAHGSGIVHRDVKPQNVLMRPGGDRHEAVLTDFGLAKVSSADGSTTQGNFVGTLPYAAPEQIAGVGVDARTDVYALGCLLFETVTARRPFGGTPLEMALAHMTEPAPRVSESVPDTPVLLDDVVVRAMSKERSKRFPSAGDFARAAIAAIQARTEFRAVGGVGVGRAAAADGTSPEQAAKLETAPGLRLVTGALPDAKSAAARERSRQRDRRRAIERDRHRAHARLVRIARAAGVSQRRCANVAGSMSQGERPTAIAVCAVRGDRATDVVLLVTNRRVLWVEEGAESPTGTIDAADLAAVRAGSTLTLTTHGSGRHAFHAWRRDAFAGVARAARELIDAA